MNEIITQPTRSGELASASAAAHSKALIEAKYVMAIQRPRNILAARDKILDACSRPGFAASAWYAKPVGGGKVRGPSIRFAETAIQCMTNITVMPTIVYEDREKIVLDVQVIDLESNTSYGDQVTLAKTVERKDRKDREVFSERVNTRGETVFLVLATEDEMANKVNSAKSKIIRNSGLRLIPQDLIEEAEAQVRQTLEKGGHDPSADMKKLADAFSNIGIKPAELEKYLGHSLESISPAEVSDLREVYATLKDGEAKWSDYVDKGTRRAERPNKAEVKPLGTVVNQSLSPADESLLDFLTLVNECSDIDELDNLRSQVQDFDGEGRTKASDAVMKRADVMGYVWSEKDGFVSRKGGK